MEKQESGALVGHGAMSLPSVIIDSYNLEIRDRNGFIGDRASKSAFREKLEDWRKRVRKGGEDPLGDTATKELSTRQIDEYLNGEDKQAAALVMSAVDDFAGDLAHVLRRFLKEASWKNTARIVVGGGMKESEFGELAIARAMILMKAEGVSIELVPIVHHPDEAGLIGAAHLMPAWMLDGYDGIVAVDIGGTNIRAGIVETRLKDKRDLSKARVWKSELWRHSDDAPARGATVERLAGMLKKLIAHAEKEKFGLAPVIGVACPGIVEPDGSIARGGQNLPGGNWESERFNLPQELTNAIPSIGKHETFVIVHNDGVVQGLSQIPFMQDVEHWGVVTIGTGLGNARFTNRNGRGD
ncbi:ROK family protein [Labrys monachus]|uniref:NBD/HSP70 family sugar kinase n=1 Tax=Labrys monachus TaxID=217067 RepID=A0ABU0FDX8_9HYPH|nr:ROK family protein [Labrys monachus]MDQ0392809.1 putative NBD/HSP70 family sugar kinase [Labrys monachus]